MWGTKNRHMIKLSIEIWHYFLIHMFITVEYMSSVLHIRRKKEKAKLFIRTLSSPRFSAGFLTNRFFGNKYIRFLFISSTASVYGLISWFIQSGNGHNDTELERGSFIRISLFQHFFNNTPKSRTGVCYSSDQISLVEYPTMVPKNLKPLCQGTSAATKEKKNSNKSKRYCLSMDGGEIINTSGLTGFMKTF